MTSSSLIAKFGTDEFRAAQSANCSLIEMVSVSKDVSEESSSEPFNVLGTPVIFFIYFYSKLTEKMNYRSKVKYSHCNRKHSYPYYCSNVRKLVGDWVNLIPK